MVAANKKEAKKAGDPAAKKRKQQEDAVSAVAARTTEEFNFPRGGASVLTPLEHKEISRKADQDVLFSNDGGSAAAQTDGEPAAKKRKSSKGKASKKSTDAAPESNGKAKAKIESLSFKRLDVGMTMLGCITKITDLSLVVSLPHQLVGSVAITEISDSITKAVEAVAQAEDEDEEGALPNLSALFKVGQWVRCCIIQLTGSDEQQGVSLDKRSKQKKRIDLSIKPEIVNSGVVANDMTKGMTLGMAVQSVEDHGYILTTGVDGITGFCHNKDAKKYIESYNNGNSLVEGQLVQFSILSVAENKRTVNVTLDPKIVSDVSFDEPCSVINSIVPGNLVSATVSSIHATGIILSFMGFFETSVDLAHIDARPEDIDSKYKVGQKLKARILFCSLNTTPKKIGASLLPNIVSFKQDNTPIEDQFPIGTVFDRVIVKRVDTKNGLVVDIDGHDHVKGFVHISRVSDSHVDALSATAGDFKLDTAHRARVVGHSLVENLLQLSMEQSVLDQQFLRVDDIQVGTIVEGTVLKLTEAGVVVNLTGSITALAPRLHLADVKLTHPEKKFKIGSKVKGLVLVSEPAKKKVIITLKRSIVNSELPVLTGYEDAKPGMVLHGTISGFRPFGCIISYCNNIRALAPISELSDSFIKDPAENFQLGQTVKTRVLTVDPSTASLRVSFKITPPVEKPAKEAKKDKTSAKAAINPVDPTIVNAQDYAPGRITKAKVTSVKESQVNLDLADNVKGRVHITEAFNDFSDIKNMKHPLRRIHHGSIIDVVVLGQHDSKSHTYLPISHRGKSNAMVECSMKFNPDAMDVDTESTRKPLEIKDLVKGERYTAFVSEVNNDSLMVNIGVNLRGRISKMHVSQDVQVLNDLKSHYIIGQALHTVVLSIDEEKKRVDLANITDGAIASDITVADVNSLEKGLIVRGTVTKTDAARGVVVKLADHLFGKIHLTDIADEFVKDPSSKLEPGHIVRCYILDVDKDSKKVDLSTRKSRLEQVDSASIVDPELNSLEDIQPDAIVKGYVQNVADKGLFVFVGRDTVGRVKISELSDDFVKDWKAMFKAGQMVEGKVLSVDKEANQLELTLKKSAIDPSIGPKKTLADFSEGEKVKGVVTSVKPIGVFIKVENSVVSGLCHISQISDTAVSDVSKIYSVGDPVKAVILNVDLTKKRISFGLKASYFDDADEESEESDEEEEVDENEDEDEDDGDEEGEEMLVDEEDDDEEDDDEDEDDDDEINGMTNLADMSDSDEDEDMEDLQESDDEPVEALPVASGFSWTGESAPAADEQESEDEESETEDTPKKKKNKKSKDVAQDKTADLSTQAPQVAADYERLLLGSPNSSYLWINYMAFQLQLSEVDKAREIGERALTKISFREEQEKLNVWVAMMNLENTFGTSDSLEAVFKRAIIVCEPKKVYLQLVKIYERSNKFDKAEELWNTTVKKFSQSSKVWTLFGMFYLQQGNVEGARTLLQRSLQSLPKRKHIKTIVKFAQLEFKHGEAERGRTIFEGVMSNYPKRVDLWSIYLDMEIRAGEQDIIRRLFQRVTSMKHSSKKMKFFFKKWLAYEKDHGTEKDIEEVKKRALAYVESISS